MEPKKSWEMRRKNLRTIVVMVAVTKRNPNYRKLLASSKERFGLSVLGAGGATLTGLRPAASPRGGVALVNSLVSEARLASDSEVLSALHRRLPERTIQTPESSFPELRGKPLLFQRRMELTGLRGTPRFR
jgi:hypothetical protein